MAKGVSATNYFTMVNTIHDNISVPVRFLRERKTL
jgi:hypothetical protein